MVVNVTYEFASASRTAAARSASLSYVLCNISGKKNNFNIAKNIKSFMSMSSHSLRPTVIERKPSTYIDIILLSHVGIGNFYSVFIALVRHRHLYF